MDIWTGLVIVLIGGVAHGALYAVLALGMALVYGVSRIFNFAHGSFFTWGAYFAWLLLVPLELNYAAAFALTIPFMYLFGLAVERVVIRPLRRRSDWQFTSIVATLGLAFFLDYMICVVFGSRLKSLPPLLEGSVNIGNIPISIHEIAITLIAIAVVAILGLFLKKTRPGMNMRAVSQDILGAQIVGIAKDKVFGYTFAISAVLAGIAGILLSPLYYLTPLGGWDPLIKSFVIVAFGGLGSMRGTLYAAIILGIVENVVALYIGSVWTLATWFLVLVFILIIRPRGLFGVWE
jgi:branched-chain amino acid transport system permease protein